MAGRVDEHKPVLVAEVLAALAVRPAGHYVDTTFGRGGHSAGILDALGPQGRLVAIDRDREAIAAGRVRFASEGRIALVHGTFGELAALLRAADPQRLVYDGILIDCGVSSPQLDNAARGFSFQKDGPLDMRMDPQRGEPVSEWLARATFEEMRNVIASFGQERFARRIASAIERERAHAPVTRTAQLAALIQRAVPTREPGKHPATRTFQALRMAVNDELGELGSHLEQLPELLADHGLAMVITFHSLEDRTVKHFFRDHGAKRRHVSKYDKSASPITSDGAIFMQVANETASAAELAKNPRARSARLRAARRLPRSA